MRKRLEVVFVPEKSNNQKGVRKLYTQIAATPTIYGEQAKKILEEAKRPPSQKALENGKKLLDYFDKIEKRGFKW
jgi:hypothetical protein